MARRSSRRRSSRALYQSSLSVGASVRSGRPLIGTSRLPGRLPRTFPSGIFVGSQFRFQPNILRSVSVPRIVLRVSQNAKLPNRRRSMNWRSANPRELSNIRIPSTQNFCKTRQEKREVMFAMDVAGRRWGSGGGPNMRDRRITSNSQYTCVR